MTYFVVVALKVQVRYWLQFDIRSFPKKEIFRELKTLRLDPAASVSFRSYLKLERSIILPYETNSSLNQNQCFQHHQGWPSWPSLKRSSFSDIAFACGWSSPAVRVGGCPFQIVLASSNHGLPQHCQSFTHIESFFQFRLLFD